MATKVLLLEDVDAFGRKGEVVNVKPGFARNYLLPQGFAVVADKHALRLQQRLKEEREKKAIVDRDEAQRMSTQIEGITILKIVKVDHDGRMYGSVTAVEVQHLLQDQIRIELEKKSILLKQPIKTTGVHTITVKLKEGITANFHLKVMSEEGHKASLEQPKAE